MKLEMVAIHDSAMLNELVVQQISFIDGQVQVVEICINTEWGSIILACDREARLVVLLLDVVQDEGLLSRLIGVSTWITRSMPLLCRLYDKRKLDSTRTPRIIAIAPGFSEAVVNGLSRLAFPVELYRYRGIEVNDERTVLIEPLRSQIQNSVLVGGSNHPEALSKASHLTEAEVRFFDGHDLRFVKFLQ